MHAFEYFALHKNEEILNIPNMYNDTFHGNSCRLNVVNHIRQKLHLGCLTEF